MTLTALMVLFIATGATTVALGLYRKYLAMHEDDLIHIGAGDEKLIPQQLAMANRMARVDHWGEALTVVTVAFGLIVAAIYLYRVFQAY